MAGTLFLVSMILLALSHPLCLKAVPLTRTESLMRDFQARLLLENNHKGEGINERNRYWEEPTITERMDLEEVVDYSPPHANNRHTPPRGPPHNG